MRSVEHRRCWLGYAREAVAAQLHIAKRCEAAKRRVEVKKKARPNWRRAFQQNVWQLLVGLSF
jgi:hypothetical protein